MNSPDNFKEILNRKFRDLNDLPPENDWEQFKNKFDIYHSRKLLYRRIAYFSGIAVVAMIAAILILRLGRENKVQPPENIPHIENQQKSTQQNNVQNNSQISDSALQRNNPDQIPYSQTPTNQYKKITVTQSNLKPVTRQSVQTQDSSRKPAAVYVKEEKQMKPLAEPKSENPGIKGNAIPKVPENENTIAEQSEDAKSQTDSLSENDTFKDHSDMPKVIDNPINDENSVPEVVNVITPNGDGINDKLIIKNIDKIGNCRLNIYNSAGEKIYSSINYQNDWYGTYNGKPLPEGTYYYVLETLNGKLYKGAVNILK